MRSYFHIIVRNPNRSQNVTFGAGEGQDIPPTLKITLTPATTTNTFWGLEGVAPPLTFKLTFAPSKTHIIQVPEGRKAGPPIASQNSMFGGDAGVDFRCKIGLWHSYAYSRTCIHLYRYIDRFRFCIIIRNPNSSQHLILGAEGGRDIPLTPQIT
jgi:hypothetical protein